MTFDLGGNDMNSSRVCRNIDNNVINEEPKSRISMA